MASPTPIKDPNAFVRTVRKVYNPIGFKKGYNFVLFVIAGGYLFGFSLSRLEYLSINGIFKTGSAPGEWFYYSRPFYKIGITIHLAAILPAGLLATLQFIPAIRYKALIVHRINGYVALSLLILGVVGALMITRYAFGGTLDTQCLMGVLAITTLGSASLAYYNIKVLQIDQHRAWMLRAWTYAASIITLRIIMIISAFIVTSIGNYYIAMPCRKIEFIGGDLSQYPNCMADPDAQTAVLADFGAEDGLEHTAASMDMSFGMAGWLALLLHAVGVELYIRLTPAEGERLRNVSWERQTERGSAHPGSAGLTMDRLGDADKWVPSSTQG